MANWVDNLMLAFSQWNECTLSLVIVEKTATRVLLDELRKWSVVGYRYMECLDGNQELE